MKFTPTAIEGLWEIRFEPVVDERGSFTRIFDEEALAALGLCVSFPQHGTARNMRAGTVRGLHFQREPYGENKIVSCVRGAIFDVIVDVRPQSATRGRWQSFELSSEEPLALYAARGLAHGYQTLVDDTRVDYMLSAQYVPDAASGVAYDSPALAIAWPRGDVTISARDRALPPFVP